MEVFNHIVSEPAFAAGVTELVYDARLFWRYFTEKEAYCKACDRAIDSIVDDMKLYDAYETSLDCEVEAEGFRLEGLSLHDTPLSIKKTLAEGCDRYIELFTQQKEILDSGTDFDVLCQGLRRLPNLRTVCIQDNISGAGNYINVHEPTPLWYFHWSATFWENTLSLTRWSLCLERARDAAEAAQNEDDTFLEDVLADHPWDWCGVANCLEAVSLHRPRIIHLHFGTQMSPFPLYTFGKAKVSTSLERIARNLRCLKLDSSLVLDGADEMPLTADSEPVSAFGKILKQAQHLATLYQAFI